jgi:hypothetical protein
MWQPWPVEVSSMKNTFLSNLCRAKSGLHAEESALRVLLAPLSIGPRLNVSAPRGVLSGIPQ